MATTQKLLTPAQVTKCKNIAASESEFSSRAAALITVHGGSSQAEAATQSGLTIGQVRYWIAKFRRLAMGAFPAPATTSVVQAEMAKKPEKKNKKAKSKVKDKKKDKANKKKSKNKEDKKTKSDKKDKKKDKAKKKTKKK